MAVSACSGDNYQDVLRTLLEKERLVEETRVNLLLAAEAEKNAVLSTTEDAATKYADQVRTAMGKAKAGLARLTMLAARTHAQKEAQLLTRITNAFGEIESVDATILGMAGRNTNLRAALLSRTEAAKTVNQLRQALAPVISGPDCQAADQALQVEAASLSILAMHAQHIEESSNTAMDVLEASMTQENQQAQAGLDRLGKMLSPKEPAVAEARKAYDALWKITQEVLSLSRENSNINALALTMGRQRQLMAAALDDLAGLKTLVEAQDFKATR